jgi:NADH:ubiquinone reductase (non-electrogenic)
VKFLEAECFKIDSVGKKVHCRSDVGTSLNGTGEFEVDYDYLVIAVGATVNTFNTPGVVENCHFLKVPFNLHTLFNARAHKYWLYRSWLF